MTTELQVADLQYARQALKLTRVIALYNSKGGVGKTSIASNLAGWFAAADYRVLLVDLNRQANVADDLGYRGNPDIDDQGEALVAALLAGKPLQPVKNVRPNLDVVPGGDRLLDLTGALNSRLSNGDERHRTALRDSLAPIAENYDIILIDSPPENPTLGNLVLCTARWIIIPTKSDIGGLVGMAQVGQAFATARQVNPDLQLLGVVLFATGSQATAIQKEVRKDVEKAFGGESPMLNSTVRHSERVARDTRGQGKLAHELEVEVQGQPPRWEALREGKKPSSLSPTTGKIADDYGDIAAEVLNIIRAAEEPA